MIDEVQKLRFEVTKLRTELDRIKSSYRVQVRDLANERDALRGELATAKTAVSFFASVIRCGESWTAACDEIYLRVFLR